MTNQEALNNVKNELITNKHKISYLVTLYLLENIKILQQAIYDLETYKLAFHKSIEAYNRLGGTPPKKILKKQIKEDEDFWLDIAKEELNNDK